MHKIRAWVRFAFGMSKVEANGLIIFLPLVLLIVLLPSMITHLTNSEVNLKEQTKKLDQLIASLEVDSSVVEHKLKPEYNIFDPNAVSSTALEKMGLSEYAVKNWQKYLSSGGEFGRPEDIKKIYGLDDSTFALLRPYVRIRSVKHEGVIHTHLASQEEHSPKELVAENKHQKPQRSSLKPFDLNLADTTTLKKIRGIGSVYSRRIVKYRESLGGFVSKEQLKEVYGLKAPVLQRMDSIVYVGADDVIRYINVNEASDEELARHPYLSWSEARAIVSYRYQHGALKSPEDLYNIQVMDSLIIAKISPYLKF